MLMWNEIVKPDEYIIIYRFCCYSVVYIEYQSLLYICYINPTWKYVLIQFVTEMVLYFIRYLVMPILLINHFAWMFGLAEARLSQIYLAKWILIIFATQ